MTQPPSSSVGTQTSAKRFSLGHLVATPAALQKLSELGITPLTLLCRHAQGDWGELCAEDREQNEIALLHGLRLLSSYSFTGTGSPPVVLWVITEWDRSVTTILLPEDY